MQFCDLLHSLDSYYVAVVGRPRGQRKVSIADNFQYIHFGLGSTQFIQNFSPTKALNTEAKSYKN